VASACRLPRSLVGKQVGEDETRHSGGVGGESSGSSRNGFRGRIIRVASRNGYALLGDAASTVLLSKDGVERAVRRRLS
jgi:hypothetical protein